MIKYKIIEIIGNREQHFETNAENFDSFILAMNRFNKINVHDRMLSYWIHASELGRIVILKANTFLGYKLIGYDTNDKSYEKYINSKYASFDDVEDIH